MRITALYESVTNRIIEEMKNGTVPWTKPWKSGKTIGVMPMNAVTGRAYSGINIPLLWHAADVHAYATYGGYMGGPVLRCRSGIVQHAAGYKKIRRKSPASQPVLTFRGSQLRL
jgi:antirestriction protein ArdC